MSSFPSNVYDKSENAVFPYGMPILDRGLAQIQAVNGFGLVTRGFLWQAYEIWGPNGDENIVTLWTADPSQSVTTTWTLDNSSELPA